MMHRLISALTLLLLTALLSMGAAPMAWSAPPPDRSFIALCYHNVEDHNPDQTFVGVSTGNLIEHLSWLKSNGYRFVSLDAIIAAHNGGAPLPEKAVLLTFDDGFESFYTRVFPILKAFGAPALLAVTGAWMADAPGSTVDYGAGIAFGPTVAYGDLDVPRGTFLTWPQVREMAASGLVEIASHTFALHKGIPANPQGNSEPAIVTHGFDAARDAYENDPAYRARLDQDAAAMARKIEQETGRAPRALVWPYGENNELAVSIAARNGMSITFSLVDALGSPDQLAAVPRHLVTPDPPITNFVTDMRSFADAGPVRVVQIDLDYVYDADPAQQERNLDRLVERISEMEISTVFLQAFADPDGTGLAREVYFPNRQLKMRADLFNRVAWQLRTRALVKVYAWMPVLAFDFGDTVATVQSWDPTTGQTRIDPGSYRRISPFDAAGRRKVLDLYEDLARAAPFEGLLFHDDALLSDYEDASAPALAAYAQAGLPASISAIRADPAAMQKWTSFKTEALIGFTQELAARARLFLSPPKTARNIYARPVLDPSSEAWFAQSFDRFLEAYDYTAIMAMPLMEEVPPKDAEAWLKRMVAVVATRPLGLRRTIFELQAVDWRKHQDEPDRKIPTATLGREMRLLSEIGAVNFGYYPDDFVEDHPAAARLHRDFSLQFYPYRP
jgi:poly-beta-1,6-N-acetyl-D-glucosamine N-deacetylase